MVAPLRIEGADRRIPQIPRLEAHSPRQGLSAGCLVAGRYQIDGVLGEGSFGAVLAATQLDTERRVALKVLMPELCQGREAARRFEREARLIRDLGHPNTVRLFDFGRTDEGAPFLVLEHLRGRSLSALLREGRLPADRVARIAAQVLKSLMEAHALGIVHRDVKPANIFLCDVEGEPDFVKLLDFGVAKSFLPDRTTTALTQTGHTVGTPSYMSPEQVVGRGVGPATDLYALGLVISEALSGERVGTGGAGSEICMQQLSPEPVSLPPVAVRSQLGPVIVRATQKRIDRRFASAAEMLEAIEEIFQPVRASAIEPRTSAGHLTQQSPPPVSPFACLPALVPRPVAAGARELGPSARPSPRRRAAALVVAGALLLAGGAVGASSWPTEAEAEAEAASAALPTAGSGAPSLSALIADPGDEPAATAAPTSTPAPTVVAARPAAPRRLAFDERAARTSLDAQVPTARACNSGAANSVIVGVRFRETGDAFSVTLSVVGGGPQYTGTLVGNCMVSRFLQSRVPPFSGGLREVFQTYRL